MFGEGCWESIFSCHSRINADIQVLEVDAGNKFRYESYDEVVDLGHLEESEGRKM